VSYGEETGDGMLHTLGGKEILAAMQEQVKVQGRALESAKGLFIRDYRGLHTEGYGGGSGAIIRFYCVFRNSTSRSRVCAMAECGRLNAPIK